MHIATFPLHQILAQLLPRRIMQVFQHNQSEQDTIHCQIALLMCLYKINLKKALIIAKLPP